MRKPLAITSPDHAAALSLYFIIGVSGLLIVLSKESGGGRIMAAMLGSGVADIWAVLLMVFGFGAFGAAVSARKASAPERSLRVEMWSCIGLFLALLLFFCVIVASVGVSGLITGSFALAIGVGSGLRAFQIVREQRILREARKHPSPSDSMLADPRDAQDE